MNEAIEETGTEPTTQAESLSIWKKPLRMPDYIEIDDMDILDHDDLYLIEKQAHILTLTQCFESIGVDINTLSEAELYYSDWAHKKGAAKAVSEACDKLFSHMKKVNGGQSALEYLKAKSGSFSVDATPTAGSNSGFSFNVTMTE